MYITVRELQRCRVQAIDHGAGVVANVLFDDQSWCVRYLVADTGRWLHRNRVLLTPSVLARLDIADRMLCVAMSAAEVECRPSIESDPPVAVLMEQRLHDVVKLAASWVTGFGEPSVFPLPPAPGVHYALSEPAPAHAWLHAGDPHLRSASHVLGHRVVTLDGPAGSVEDLVIDDAGWRITDLVVQAHGRQRRTSQLVPTRWVDDVSWGMRTVHVRVLGDRIDPGSVRGPSSAGAGRRPPSVRSS